MDIGYSITSRHPLNFTPSDAADRILSRARAADEAGIDYVQAGDHHAEGNALYFQNIPTLARITSIFNRVGGMFLLPLHNPLLVAEQVGTLAAFVDTFDFWCAVGYKDHEFDAFGIPKSERGRRLEESLSLIQQLWTNDEVTFEGDFHSLKDVSINPTADPRICLGGSAKAAVQRAGRMGDAWVVAPYASSAEIAHKLDWFEDAGGGDLVVRRDALVLEDGDKANSRADALLEAGYRSWSPEDRDVLLVGDAEGVSAELDTYRDLGVDEVVVRPMSDDHVTETFRELVRARDL